MPSLIHDPPKHATLHRIERLLHDFQIGTT
jgi:hypothetical protein